MSLATNGGMYEPPYAMMVKVAASICGSYGHTKSSVARNLAPPGRHNQGTMLHPVEIIPCTYLIE